MSERACPNLSRDGWREPGRRRRQCLRAVRLKAHSFILALFLGAYLSSASRTSVGPVCHGAERTRSLQMQLSCVGPGQAGFGAPGRHSLPA